MTALPMIETEQTIPDDVVEHIAWQLSNITDASGFKHGHAWKTYGNPYRESMRARAVLSIKQVNELLNKHSKGLSFDLPQTVDEAVRQRNYANMLAHTAITRANEFEAKRTHLMAQADLLKAALMDERE